MSAMYPYLLPTPLECETEAAAAAASASAPSAPLTSDIGASRAALCSVCNKSVDRTRSCTLLSCGHAVHFPRCTEHYFRASSLRKRRSQLRDEDQYHRSAADDNDEDNGIGGIQWCQACADAASAASGHYNDSMDPDLEQSALLSALSTRHAKKFDRLVDARIEHGAPSVALERELLGSNGLSSRVGSALGALTKSAATAASQLSALRSGTPHQAWPADTNDNGGGGGPDDDRQGVPDERTIVSRMQERGRTLDEVFRTTQLDLADLYVAGVRTLDDLRRLGFTPAVHLQRCYRRRLPIFALVRYYALDWNELRSLPHRDTSRLGLRASELRVLGCSMAELVRDKWTARDVYALGLPPSTLVRYLGMQLVHLNALGITVDSFARQKQWAEDFKNQRGQFYRLVSGPASPPPPLLLPK